MPWRSIAFATRSARCVNTRFMRFESFVRCLCMVLSGRRAGSRLPYRRRPVTSVFYLFRDAPQRRAALELEPGSAARYVLYGMDQLAERGYAVRHNLERPQPPAWARPAGAALKRGLEARRRVRRRLRDSALVAPPAQPGRRRVLDGRHGRHPADAPRAGACRAPAVRLRGDRAARAARAARVPSAWSGSTRRRSVRRPRCSPTATHEAEALSGWLASTASMSGRVRAVRGRRRGVPADRRAAGRRRRLGRGRPASRLRAAPRRSPGRCPTRASSSSRRPIARARSDGRPDNVAVETDLPFDEMRRRLERARVVALPVRDNSYSGATTVLLQAMALAKPVVVTRTAAIATGYGLEDGDNVRLVGPGDGGVLRPRARRAARRRAGARARRARRGDGRGGAHVGALRGADRGAARMPRSRDSPRSPAAALSSPRESGRSESGRGRVLALGLGLLLVLLEGRARASQATRASFSAWRRGCWTATPLRRRLREQGSALLLHVRRRLVDRRLARAVPARRSLARSRASRHCAPRSRARCAALSSGRELLRLPAGSLGRLVPRRAVDAGRARVAPFAPWLWLRGRFAAGGAAVVRCSSSSIWRPRAAADRARCSWSGRRIASSARADTRCPWPGR